ncbi:hypothetical protein SSOG_03125 [Streptomyces himastatinicus ATCC 53653]|uniref:Uncharacterized protein n=1 Tax=Streptomyces himastatinicus ATCC 53653 TaxID=457427 RepID=D9WI28_9ACTN|nr:hypothetical protein SSOG_03125 [Streptomyces himastatinicus ATCC 53653]
MRRCRSPARRRPISRAAGPQKKRFAHTPGWAEDGPPPRQPLAALSEEGA